MTNSKKGKCLCGAVSFTAGAVSESVGVCHCSMCRVWGGGPLFAVDCSKDINFSGEKNISVFNSSDWGERGFCNQCGSHLFYRLKSNNQYIVPAGLFEDSSSFNFDHQVFIEQKPEYYSFSNDTKNMTGEEMFAEFSQPSSE
jgi:hypothetical protein